MLPVADIQPRKLRAGRDIRVLLPYELDRLLRASALLSGRSPVELAREILAAHFDLGVCRVCGDVFHQAPAGRKAKTCELHRRTNRHGTPPAGFYERADQERLEA